MLKEAYLHNIPFKELFDVERLIDAVDGESLQAMARRVLHADNYVLYTLYPE